MTLPILYTMDIKYNYPHEGEWEKTNKADEYVYALIREGRPSLLTGNESDDVNAPFWFGKEWDEKAKAWQYALKNGIEIGFNTKKNEDTRVCNALVTLESIKNEVYQKLAVGTPGKNVPLLRYFFTRRGSTVADILRIICTTTKNHIKNILDRKENETITMPPKGETSDTILAKIPVEGRNKYLDDKTYDFVMGIFWKYFTERPTNKLDSILFVYSFKLKSIRLESIGKKSIRKKCIANKSTGPTYGKLIDWFGLAILENTLIQDFNRWFKEDFSIYMRTQYVLKKLKETLELDETAEITLYNLISECMVKLLNVPTLLKQIEGALDTLCGILQEEVHSQKDGYISYIKNLKSEDLVKKVKEECT